MRPDLVWILKWNFIEVLLIPSRSHDPTMTPRVNNSLALPLQSKSTAIPEQSYCRRRSVGIMFPTEQEDWGMETRSQTQIFPLHRNWGFQASLSWLKLENEIDFTFYGKQSKETFYMKNLHRSAILLHFILPKISKMMEHGREKVAIVRPLTCHQPEAHRRPATTTSYSPEFLLCLTAAAGLLTVPIISKFTEHQEIYSSKNKSFLSFDKLQRLRFRNCPDNISKNDIYKSNLT